MNMRERSDKATVREVGLRDGLQMVGTILTAQQKIEWCTREVAAGVWEIEVTSFVPPKLVPQFGDSVEVARAALGIAGLHASALVPNLKGAQRAAEAGLRKIDFVLSASDAHNQKNVRRSTAESVEDFGRIIEWRKEAAPDLVVGAGIATAFGCAISSEVRADRVLGILDELLAHGADEITIADTVGYANPAQVRALMREVIARVGGRPLTCHFHDTRGLGLANVDAAAQTGVRIFDASLGGLGGCPFASNATGNINTEDCVYLLKSMGLDTGIDVRALLELRREIETWLPGEPFVGAISRAGLPKTYDTRAVLA
ncbi:Hydroxymethylglutaryl-CoA lyase [Candidatus Burkholderia verschuerenii]|uniref:Hydroxymethylglutaryl-CoA lyase n=2 Tax=Candidatus Burkholderia verschuerenii TaxID=242163 RepID=A0A0L0MJG2_9BURK|nr:hydroxymethylglutaryl-CoA lyase [Candidatus Burkholderia verschuerenii]KND62104.1 Hydroxymethylglutaryl-CoA lyase [Candidatus Burkholderia verschuerenii]